MAARTTARSSRARVVVPVVGAILLVLGVGWWLLDRASEGHDDGPATSYATTVAGLCRAATQAEAGDRTDAENTFYDRSHRTLHLLAAKVEQVDRPLAARLLETKNIVESQLVTGGTSLPANLRKLAEDTRAGVTAIGQTAPAGCAA